jgi:hypothetical protein
MGEEHSARMSAVLPVLVLCTSELGVRGPARVPRQRPCTSPPDSRRRQCRSRRRASVSTSRTLRPPQIVRGRSQGVGSRQRSLAPESVALSVSRGGSTCASSVWSRLACESFGHVSLVSRKPGVRRRPVPTRLLGIARRACSGTKRARRAASARGRGPLPGRPDLVERGDRRQAGHRARDRKTYVVNVLAVLGARTAPTPAAIGIRRGLIRQDVALGFLVGHVGLARVRERDPDHGTLAAVASRMKEWTFAAEPTRRAVAAGGDGGDGVGVVLVGRGLGGRG